MLTANKNYVNFAIMTYRDSNIAQMISSRIKNKDPKAEIILFGSHARGDAKNDSDWDVLILIDQNKTSRSIEKKYRDEMFKLELEIGQPISTFVFSKSDWNTKHSVTALYKNVQKEGVKL
jgi:predicted nucleotidyltransferase